MHIPFDPAILLAGIYPKNTDYNNKNGKHSKCPVLDVKGINTNLL